MTQLFRNSLPQEKVTSAPLLPVPLSFERNWLHDLESRLDKGGRGATGGYPALLCRESSRAWLPASMSCSV